VLPNLVIIGARKCATTSLYHYLYTHPQVWVSDEKELNFFYEQGNWHRGRAWYESWFPVAAPVRCEGSPAYTSYPRYDRVPERMAALLPDARLIYLVRDPIERLISHYVMDHAFGYEQRRLAEAVDDLERSIFVYESRYWMQLERYLEHFAPERILVLDQHDLRAERAPTLRRVFRFLEIDEEHYSPAFEVEHLTRVHRRRRAPAARLIRALNSRLGPGRAYHLRRRVPRPLFLLFSEPLATPRLADATRARLLEHFAPDVARLREFTGQAFATWST
jgi:hypothetical protein